MSSNLLPPGLAFILPSGKYGDMDSVDKEILEIYNFCLQRIGELNKSEGSFAIEQGLNPKDITKFKGHIGKFHKSKITFRNTYRILRGLLNYPPILLPLKDKSQDKAIKINKIEASEYKELFDLTVDVLADHKLASPKHLENLKGRLELMKEDIEEAKKQVEDPPSPKAPPPNPAGDRRTNMDPYHGQERRKKAA
jgi:hypothetical protein